VKILHIWLKTPIPAPKITRFFVFYPQTLFFVIETPKGTSLAETAHFEPLSVAIGPAGSPAQRAKNTKKDGEPDGHPKNGVLAPPTPLIRS